MSTRIDRSVEQEVAEFCSEGQRFEEAVREHAPVETESIHENTKERYDSSLSPRAMRAHLEHTTVEDAVDLGKVTESYELTPVELDELCSTARSYRHDPYNAQVYALKTIKSGFYPPIVLDGTKIVDGVHRILALSELGAEQILAYKPEE